MPDFEMGKTYGAGVRLVSPVDRLLHYLPDGRVAVGAICTAAELRIVNGDFDRDRPPAIDAAPRDGKIYGCGFDSGELDETCHGEVQNGPDTVEVVSAGNSTGDCIKALECAARIVRSETI
jgi:hypothetical protein